MQVPEEARREDLGLPGAGAVVSCELPDMSVENQIYVLCKSNRHT